MISVLKKKVNDLVINELLKSNNLDYFRANIFYVNYKGKELYSFPFFNSSNEITKHIIIHHNFRKIIHQNQDKNSFWLIKSKVKYPKYLIISDKPENIIKYVSDKNYFFKKTTYMCYVPSNFNNKSFDYLNQNFKYERVLTVFSNSIMKDFFKLKTTFLINEEIVYISIIKNGYLIDYKSLKFEVENVDYAYLRRRLKLKLKVPILHKKH
ncbi:hypothetical protein [Tenacibaculum finnmarkense]|uniref:hypothetical protein n=1 Tax=Tenacibaculum finnmarkense TaxID=2781243 RepID=UPI001EFB6E48|nr:hypothetical protein [Tenacibaculum finnmarkense]MCG8226370.1 hypothetical protein [Tenacibaculum finnmarkense genomovar finnmarkense]